MKLRFAAIILAAALASSPALAQPGAAGLAALRTETPATLKLETYRLWAGSAPGARGDSPADIPTLTLFRPQPGHESGTAIVIAPGGGYMALAQILEGIEPAAWFTSHGVTAFVLTYRVGAAARLPTVLADGARAIRFARAHAADFRIDPNRIGMMGFSAGGHLAASTALGMAEAPDSPGDAIDRVSAWPDFLVLAYPWLEATKLGPDGHSQYCDFAQQLKIACNPKNYTRFLPLDHVTDNAPPTFIYHTTDDGLVPVDGSIRFYEALHAHKISVELHAFASGPHGTGLGSADPALTAWPALLENWLRARGLIGGAARPR